MTTKTICGPELPTTRGEVGKTVSRLLLEFEASSPSLRALNPPDIAANRYGLIQERLSHNLFHLVVQSILWNQTSGEKAKPVLALLITLYPDAPSMFEASVSHLAEILKPIGLNNVRADRLHRMSEAWIRAPPDPLRRYRKLNYPNKGDGKDIGPHEVLALNDGRQGWEIAHLPGIGRYALDSFRLFYRDTMLASLAESPTRDSWEEVNPHDKELLLYVAWKRAKLQCHAS